MYRLGLTALLTVSTCLGQAPSTKKETSLPTTFLFLHGLGGKGKNVEWYTKNPAHPSQWSIITGPYRTFDFPDAGKGKGEIIRKEVNLGQEKDMAKARKEYSEILTDLSIFSNPDEGIVMLGSSRGAITALNMAGNWYLPRLRAIIAEAPTDDFSSMPSHFIPDFFKGWLTRGLIGHAGTLFDAVLPWWYGSYKPEGINPLKMVKKINPELPVLFVHSLDDELISPYCSMILYYKMLESGHNPEKLFLLLLPQGRHGKYNFSSFKAGDFGARMYQTAAHAFYRRFNIPHKASLAKEGEKYLNRSQPSLEEIRAQLQHEAEKSIGRLEKAANDEL